jgi:AcrR family transcriptional regulator
VDVLDRHICALVHGPDDLYGQLGPFILDGLRAGERALHLVDDRAGHVARLGALGVDTVRLVHDGQLEVLEWGQSYLRGGTFSRAAMLDFLRETLDSGRRMGFARTRLVASADWAAEGTPWTSELVPYETEVGGIFRARRDVAICVYDLERHSASVITGVRDAHSLALIDGALRPNRPLSRPSARERIVAAADEQFHDLGIRAAGVDAIIAAAGVAKATFYRHFPSKDDLVVAWLRDDRPRWLYRVRASVEASGRSAAEKLPLFFEETARWLEGDGYRGCCFHAAALEITDSSHPAWPVIRAYLDEIEGYLRELLEAAGARDAAALAPQLGVLLTGGLDLGVARRSTTPLLVAREVAMGLLGDS